MEKFFVFDNFLASPELLFNSGKYKQVMDSFIANGRLKGAQLTHYHDPQINPPQPHIKTGGWFADPDDSSLIQDIKDAVSAASNGEIVSQERGSIIELGQKSSPRESTNLIACYAYELSILIQSNGLSVPESYAWIAAKLLQLMEKEDKISMAMSFLSGNDKIEWNIKKVREINQLGNFIKNFEQCIDAQLDCKDEDLSFVLERLFHLCNNTSCMDYAKEKEIYQELVNLLIKKK